MMGISSLPGAQQNPGQAAIPQAIPAAQPKTPQAMTGQLQNLPPQQLMAMFANPTDSTPKWAVITAYAKAIEQQRLMQAAQGQNAMQQGQMQVGQPPVAMQVMAQGVEPQFSSGGAVALQSGGLTTGFAPTYTAMRAAGIDISPYDSEEVRADKHRRFEEYKRTGVVPPPTQREVEDRLPGVSPEEVSGQSVTPKGLPAGLKSLISNPFEVARLVAPWSAGILPESPRALREKMFGDRPSYYAEELYGKPRNKNAGISGVAMQLDPKNLLAIPSLEAALKDPNLPRVERIALQDTLARLYATRAEIPADTGVPSGLPSYTAPPSAPQGAGGPGLAALPTATTTARQGVSSTLPSDIEAAMKGRIEQLEGARTLPPGLLEARRGLAGLEASNIAAQRAATEAFGKESAEALAAARAARGASRLDDIQYLGQMLEGMRGAKRLGEGLSGAAVGAGRAEGARAAALKEAERERRADQRLIRTEEAAGRQLQILAAQRNIAEQQGDFDRVAKIDADIAQVRLGLANAKQAQAEKAAAFGLDERKVAADELRARAAMAGAEVRQAGAGSAEQRQAIQAMRADPSYAGVVKELTEAKKLAAIVKSPMAQSRLQAAEKAANDLARAYGVTPEMMGMGTPPAATAAPAPTQSDPLGIRKP